MCAAPTRKRLWVGDSCLPIYALQLMPKRCPSRANPSDQRAEAGSEEREHGWDRSGSRERSAKTRNRLAQSPISGSRRRARLRPATAWPPPFIVTELGADTDPFMLQL